MDCPLFKSWRCLQNMITALRSRKFSKTGKSAFLWTAGGRWRDNIYIERFWRSMKYECIYLHAYETGSQAREASANGSAFTTASDLIPRMASEPRTRFMRQVQIYIRSKRCRRALCPGGLICRYSESTLKMPPNCLTKYDHLF